VKGGEAIRAIELTRRAPRMTDMWLVGAAEDLVTLLDRSLDEVLDGSDRRFP
jgi:hypothetical protein